MFAWLYGVRPWELDRLTFGEVRVFRRFARKLSESRG